MRRSFSITVVSFCVLLLLLYDGWQFDIFMTLGGLSSNNDENTRYATSDIILLEYDGKNEKNTTNNQDFVVLGEVSNGANTTTTYNKNNVNSNELVADIVFVHLGKTAGSSITCMLDPSIHHSGKGNSQCNNYNNTTQLAASSASAISKHVVKRIHLEPAPSINTYDNFLITVRNPVERIISWYYYLHPKFPPAKLPRHKHGCDNFAIFDCWDDIQSLTDKGLVDQHYYASSSLFVDRRNKTVNKEEDGDEEICISLAWDIIRGKKKCWHNYYNYNYTYGNLIKEFHMLNGSRAATTEMMREKNIFAIRTEHLQRDWETIEVMLGSSNSTGISVLHKNEWNNNSSSSPNKALSRQGRLNLCKALCEEIQIYKQLLQLAVNIDAEREDESLDELLQTCPNESRQVKACGLSKERHADETETDMFDDTEQPDHLDHHDYGVFIVNYHKTGHVLTRALTNLAVNIEYVAQGLNKTEVNMMKKNYPSSGYNEKVGNRVAFARLLDPFPIRNHNESTNYPDHFNMSGGTMYIQEAPDLYCNISTLAKLLMTKELPGAEPFGGTKIVHFVRNPFDMALSNYYYHAQQPPTESWVFLDKPCEHRYGDNISLATHVLPNLSSDTNITEILFDNVVSLCKSLYQANPQLRNSTFYKHLLHLSPWDGLQLATAQMIISSSHENQGRAGGDILRMASNIVHFNNLLSLNDQYEKQFHLLTISMDDYISHPINSTVHFLDFLFGEHNDIISKEQKLKAAHTNIPRQSSHVTSGKNESSRRDMRIRLRYHPVLGPILNETEMLVNKALVQSKH